MIAIRLPMKPGVPIGIVTKLRPMSNQQRRYRHVVAMGGLLLTTWTAGMMYASSAFAFSPAEEVYSSFEFIDPGETDGYLKLNFGTLTSAALAFKNNQFEFSHDVHFGGNIPASGSLTVFNLANCNGRLTTTSTGMVVCTAGGGGNITQLTASINAGQEVRVTHSTDTNFERLVDAFYDVTTTFVKLSVQSVYRFPQVAISLYIVLVMIS